MSTIRPFTAIRYATSPKNRDLSARLAPPYDVLSQADKDTLLARDPRNFVKIDLPHVPPKAAGPAEAYQAAAQTLADWLADGTFVRDEAPGLYVYHQRYRYAEREYTRRMFFARLRLEPFGQGTVFPHEQTFGGPKEDRLALTKATKANLSPIFGLYEDRANAVSERLVAALPDEPLAEGTLDEVENLLWCVRDQACLDEVINMMRPKPVYIADGHHRYGTAMLYRDWLVEQQGPLPEEHPANYVLCVFCAMEDPGLLILPTHRVVPAVQVEADLLRQDPHLLVDPLNVPEPEAVIHALKPFGPQAVALYSPTGEGYWAVRPRRADILVDFAPEKSPAWRALGLAFLHTYLLDEVVTKQVLAGKSPEIRYIKSAADAVAQARETRGCAFLMQPTTMEELRSVCGAGDLMPQKSTYFYPKLASGLVINPLED